MRKSPLRRVPSGRDHRVSPLHGALVMPGYRGVPWDRATEADASARAFSSARRDTKSHPLIEKP